MKKYAPEPESTKPGIGTPLKLAVTSPNTLVVTCCAVDGSTLLLCVLTPNVIVPDTEPCPPSATAGKLSVIPLLSVANFVTGLGTCSASGTATPVQFEPAQS